MKKSIARSLLIMGLLLGVIAGCGSEKQDDQTPRYQVPTDWVTYTYQNVKIAYPPDHLHASGMHDFAVWYNWALRQDLQFLKLRMPVDTLIVFNYTGHGQGNEMTEHYYPWADSNVIHFWQPSHKGPTLMQFLLPYWLDKEPQYKFLREGMISLLDFSDQNYHEMTWRFYQNDSLISLAELAIDTTVDSNKERYRSALAASFVDFLVIHYKIEGLRYMYRAEADWNLATEGILHTPSDTLQTRWLKFVEQVVKGEWPPQQPDSTGVGQLPFDPESEG